MKRREFIKTGIGAGVGCGFVPVQSLFAQQAAGKTLFDKIWEAHEISFLGGVTSVLHVDRMMLPDSGPSSIRRLLQAGEAIRNPELVWAVADHQVSTSPERYTNRSLNLGSVADEFPEMKEQLAAMGIQAFGIDDPEQGIQHVVGPETGLTLPGMLMVAG